MDLITLALARKHATNLFNQTTGIQSIIVEQLPTIGQPNTIYFIVKQDAYELSYSEYMYIDNHWELIGNKESDIIVNQKFPANAVTNKGIGELCESLNASAGECYLGGIQLTDMPKDVINGECMVSTITSLNNGSNVYYLELYSSNIAPHKWYTIYWTENPEQCPGWLPLVQQSDIGNLQNLTTTNKTNLVAAINELKAEINNLKN